jgi:predicted small metal-binding protein
MMKAVEHARTIHDVDHLSEPLRAQIRAAIKDG